MKYATALTTACIGKGGGNVDASVGNLILVLRWCKERFGNDEMKGWMLRCLAERTGLFLVKELDVAGTRRQKEEVDDRISKNERDATDETINSQLLDLFDSTKTTNRGGGSPKRFGISS